MRPFLLLFLSCWALLSCSPHMAGEHRLTVSIEPLRYFVESIAGERFEVHTLVPAGASPETYELTPQQVVAISESQAYFSVGTLGFEKTRLQQLTDNNPSLLTVNVSDSIALLAMEQSCCQHDSGAHQHSDGIDLHTWASASSGRKIAKRVYETLVQLDTLHASEYKARYDSLLTHIDQIDTQIRTTLRNVQHRSFLIYHPALGYFARDYGLRQIAVEQDGKEPSAERMQSLIHQAQSEQISVVFIQEEHAGRAAQRLAEALGARVVSCAPLSREWDKQLLHIAREIAR